MIWARPLSWSGDLEALPMLARTGLSASERALVVSGLERVAVVTGLDAVAREELAHTVGTGWLGGAGDAALIRYSPGALDRWCLAVEPNHELFRALRRLAVAERPLPEMVIGPRRFEWGTRTYLMGVLNVTPDSFSDGRAGESLAHVVERGEALAQAGAEIIDVGGESTRPGAAAVELEEELRRVVPVVRALASRVPQVALSIDTSKPEVARAALDAGAHLVNDVTALADERMLEVVAEFKVPACVMHMRGTPRTMQGALDYDDVVAEVLDGLETALQRAEGQGVARTRLLVDPGIGFGKSVEQNLFLLRQLNAFRLLGAPVLVGTSRKSFLGSVTGRAVSERLIASAASVAVAAVLRGADLVRVHDVTEAKDAVAVADAVAKASVGGRLFVSV